MSTRKSLFFSFLDRYASLAISIIYSMVIARLLTPGELGIFSVTMVLLGFVSTVRDMGAGQYLVQEKELTTDRIRAVWAVQLGLGVGLACLVLLASYPVALFYDEPRMRNIMLLVALNYLINPFGSLTYAWLMREMRFESVALMRFSSALGGAVISSVLAWKDYGPISLAFGSVASTLINALLAIRFRPKTFPWLPGTKEIRRVLGFGSQLTVGSIVLSLATAAPELFLGKLQGLTAAGLYSRAGGLVQMFHRLFVDAVWVVCLPWFAKQNREEGNFVEPFLKATGYVTAFGWSFCLVVMCLAQPIIRILYGDQWDQAVDITRLLAFAMVFTVPAALCQPALLSAGEVGIITRVNFSNALATVIFVALGASQGLTILGICMIAAAIVSATFWLRATAKFIGVPVVELLRSWRASMLVALLAGIAPAIALWIYGPYPKDFLMPFVLGGTGSLVGFLVGVFVFNHPLRQEISGAWSKLNFRLV